MSVLHTIDNSTGISRLAVNTATETNRGQSDDRECNVSDLQ